MVQETYPGGSQSIQSRVYDRLERLTRLGRLELGNEHRDLHSVRYSDRSKGESVEIDEEGSQLDCLDMSLQRGLWRLEGLKDLRVLGVVGMATRIGPKEKQWIKENWPKIERLDLNGDDDVVYLK